LSARFAFRDGDRMREAEVAALAPGRFRVTVDGVAAEIGLEALGDGRLRLLAPQGAVLAEVTAAGSARFVRVQRMDFVLEREASGRPRARAHGGGLEAPMPGVVTRVLVTAGEAVRQGQPLVAIEAMKMEHVLRSPRDGRVRAVSARPGEMVSGGAALVELEEADGS
jgi:3-methylcrotonyl-CoA carboxylase alpha subunit